MNGIREKRKRSDTSSTYDYIMKMQGSNADKVLIGSIIIKLILEGKIVNKNNPQGLYSL